MKKICIYLHVISVKYIWIYGEILLINFNRCEQRLPAIYKRSHPYNIAITFCINKQTIIQLNDMWYTYRIYSKRRGRV